MNAVRVDVSKGKNMVSVLCPLGQVAAKPFVRHTGKGLRELAKYLKSLEGKTRVVIEHTGRYYESTAQYLSGAGIFVSAVNPKLIKDYGNNSLRKVKTDKADSRKIAKHALDNWAELRQYTSTDKTRYQPKVLNRQCNHLTADRTAQKNSLIAISGHDVSGRKRAVCQSCQKGWDAEMGGFCQDFLAFGLCTGYQSGCFHRALPGMVQEEQITSTATKRHKSTRTHGSKSP